MESKILLLLVIVALFPAFQESSKLAELEIRGSIHIDQEFAYRTSPPGVPISSPPDLARRKPVSLKTDYRPNNYPKLMLPQQEETLIDHAPISIYNNADFANQGFPGAGTLLDPYRIEGLNITSSSVDLIIISYTTAYFRISGNYINGLGTAHWGINVDNVIHGTIENNFVVNNANSIGVSNSDDCNITNNNVYNSTGVGIQIESSENNTISHNFVNETLQWVGISLIESTYNVLVNNTVLHNAGWAGILLDSSNYTQLINNSAYENNGNGIVLQSSHFNEVVNNTAFNNSYPGIRLEGSNDNKIAGNRLFQNNAHGLWLFHDNSRNNIHHNRAYDNNWDGIALLSSDSNFLHDNNIYSNYNGLFVEASEYNTLANNVVHQNDIGIDFADSRSNQVIDNTVFDNFWGIYLVRSDENIIFGNTIDENGRGVQLEYSSFNTFDHNSITNSSEYGILILSSTNNLLWANVLAVNGKANAYDSGERNKWDNGAIGNYWDDYIGEDKSPRDGIGDTPYGVAGYAGAQDRFPLIGLPGSESLPPRIDHPPDIVYEENTRGHTITWQTFDANPDSFMLWLNGISIENGSWQGGQLVFKIDRLPFGVHNFTLGVNDTSGDWSHDTIHVTVTNPKIAASSFIIMIATGTAMLSIGTLVASRGFSRRKTGQRRDLKRQLQQINLQLQQFQKVVNSLSPPATLQELGEILQDVHPRFERCKSTINENRLAMTRKWLPSFLRPDVAPLERLVRSLNETYTQFTQQYLKWAEELMDE